MIPLLLLLAANIQPVSNFQASASASSIALSWSYSGNVNGFKLDRQANGVWVQIASLNSSQRAYTDPGLSPSTTYNYRIRATKGNNSSPYAFASASIPSCGQLTFGAKTIVADVQAVNPVSRVSFFMDSNALGFITAPPYEWPWNTLTIPNGCHSLSATATDTLNQVGQSMLLPVQVMN